MVGGQSGQEKLRVRLPPSPVPPSQPRGLFLPGDSQVWPRIPGSAGEGMASWLSQALARPRGDRKPGHRGLSLATAAQPQSGRKFCRALSAGASLVILLNRKPGSAGVARSRRERGTPSPRVPAGASGGEAGERTPRGARASRVRSGEPSGVWGGRWGGGRERGRVGEGRVRQVAGPHPGAPRACSPCLRAGAGAARAASHGEEKVGEGLPSIWGREGSRPRLPAPTQALTPL